MVTGLMLAMVLAGGTAARLHTGDGGSAEVIDVRSGGESCTVADRGRLLGYERVASYEDAAAVRAYFDEWIAFYQDYYAFPSPLPVQFTHGFDSYRVAYCTVDVPLPAHTNPRPTVATGMVSVPRAAGRLSTVVYLHGTSVSFYDAVSNPDIAGEYNENGESFDGPPSNAIFAGGGFIYIAPDYLGLGGSPVPRHRYFHAGTEASSSIDLLAAARRVLNRLQVRQDDRLFTFGFSQGGHAALALHRAFEADGVDVRATATVGGVFDVERWFLWSLDNRTTSTLPLYMAYLLLSYDDIYDIYDDPAGVFRQPYAQQVGSLFDMQHYFDDVLGGLPANTGALLTPSFRRSVVANPWHPFRLRLRQNAVDGWRPRAPVRIYHSPDDEEVPFGGMLLSALELYLRGADVSVRPLRGFDHVTSWIQAMPRAVTWFRQLR